MSNIATDRGRTGSPTSKISKPAGCKPGRLVTLGRLDHGWWVRPEGREAIPKRPREYARLLHFDSLTHGAANLRFLIAQFGAERVVMGSDYPFDLGSPDPVAAVGEAGLDAGARALVEGARRRSSSASEGHVFGLSRS